MCAYMSVLDLFHVPNYFSFCLQENGDGAVTFQEPLPRQKGKYYTSTQCNCVPHFNFL